MVIINLTELGPVAPRWVTQRELTDIYEAANNIIADTAEADLDQIIDEWSTALTWRALTPEPVDDAWYLRALLVVALRGIRGEIAPSFYWISDDN